MKKRIAAAAASVVVAVSVPAFAGPDWIERGDAGSFLESAQEIVGITTNLRSISGTLGTVVGGGLLVPDFEDVYLLRIEEPGTFKFEILNAAFDAQLFLFNVTEPGEAFGLLANNDTALGNAPLLRSPATDGSGAQVLLPGVYALGISGLGNVPTSLGGPLFNFASPTEISGADGMGGFLPHSGWSGPGQTGGYEIEVEGVTWYDVPAPGSGGLLIAGLGAMARRRRR